MAQILLPDAVIAQGDWTGDHTDLQTDDDNYAISDQVPSGATSTLEVSLDDGDDPAVSTDHVIRVRWKADGGGGAHSDEATVALYQGTTEIATYVRPTQLGNTEEEDTYTLTGTEADSITDYDDLRFRLWSNEGRRSLYVDLVQLELPDASLEDTEASVSHAEFEVPSADKTAQVSHAELEVPIFVDAPGDLDPSSIIALYDARNITGDEDDPVSAWQDESENEQPDLVQATGTKQPLIDDSGFGGVRSVRFDGTDDFLNTAFNGATHTGDFAIIMVLEVLDFPTGTAVVVYSTSVEGSDKHILGIDDTRDPEGWVVMSGDGGQDEHYTGTNDLAALENVPSRYSTVQLIEKATDRLRLFENGSEAIDQEPATDDPEGLNDLNGLHVGSREDDTRHSNFRVGYIAVVDMTNETLTTLLSANTEVQNEFNVTASDPDRLGQVSHAELETPSTPSQGQVSWAELETADAPREGQVSHAELETGDAPDTDREGQLSYAELETPDAARLGQLSYAELEAPTAPREGQVSHAEFETADAPRETQVSHAELEAPTAPREGQLSYAELEIPTAPREGQLSHAELETTDAPRQAQASYAALETDDAPRSSNVSWAELQTDESPRTAQIAHAEVETGDGPRKGEVSYAELEAPENVKSGQVSYAVLETPDAPTTDRRGQASYAELEAPTAPRGAQLSQAELEATDAPRTAQVSNAYVEGPLAPREAQLSVASLETADAPRSGQLSHAEIEAPTAPRRVGLAHAEMEVGEAPRSAEVSHAYVEAEDAPRGAAVSHAEVETGDAKRAGAISYAEFEAEDAPRSGEISYAHFEVDEDGPRATQISYAEIEVPTADRNAELSYASLETPLAPRNASLSYATLELPSYVYGYYKRDAEGNIEDPGIVYKRRQRELERAAVRHLEPDEDRARSKR